MGHRGNRPGSHRSLPGSKTVKPPGGGGGSKKPRLTQPNSTAGPQHGPVNAHTSRDAPAVTGLCIPDAWAAVLATGIRWRPAQCRIWGAAGRQDAHAARKRLPVDAQRGQDTPTWPDSMFPGALAPCLVRSGWHGCSRGLPGSGSTAAAGGVTGAPAGKTAGWTRTPGFSLCCYHVNPRTYRTAEAGWGR